MANLNFDFIFKKTKSLIPVTQFFINFKEVKREKYSPKEMIKMEKLGKQ
jgi:hypothetical protein